MKFCCLSSVMNPVEDQSEKVDFDGLYWALMECDAQLSIFAEEYFLREMGIYGEVDDVVETSSWKDLLTLSCEANMEDTCEFLALAEVKVKFLRYRHRGVCYHATDHHLKQAFGWTSSAQDERDQHTNEEAWKALTMSKRF